MVSREDESRKNVRIAAVVSTLLAAGSSFGLYNLYVLDYQTKQHLSQTCLVESSEIVEYYVIDYGEASIKSQFQLFIKDTETDYVTVKVFSCRSYDCASLEKSYPDGSEITCYRACNQNIRESYLQYNECYWWLFAITWLFVVITTVVSVINVIWAFILCCNPACV